jgi:hypothetical protein
MNPRDARIVLTASALLGLLSTRAGKRLSSVKPTPEEAERIAESAVILANAAIAELRKTAPLRRKVPIPHR